MTVFVGIFRHELPTEEVKFMIPAYGFKSLSLQMENDIPVMYEIGATSDNDNKPYPHHFVWVSTGEQLPKGLDSSSFVGTIQFSNGRVAHLFREWEK